MSADKLEAELLAVLSRVRLDGFHLRVNIKPRGKTCSFSLVEGFGMFARFAQSPTFLLPRKHQDAPEFFATVEGWIIGAQLAICEFPDRFARRKP